MENDIFISGAAPSVVDWNADSLRFRVDRDANLNRTPKQKDTDMDKNYADARTDLLAKVKDALDGVEGIRVLRSRDATDGPMGGTSAEVIGFTDDGEDGGLIAFAINIYADEKIEAKADRIVDAIKAEREKREAIFGDDSDA